MNSQNFTYRSDPSEFKELVAGISLGNSHSHIIGTTTSGWRSRECFLNEYVKDLVTKNKSDPLRGLYNFDLQSEDHLSEMYKKLVSDCVPWMEKLVNEFRMRKIRYPYAVVFTVPGYFQDKQRMVTKEAALLADFNIMRIIDDATAIALAYNLDELPDQKILVVGSGAKFTYATVLTSDDGIFTKDSEVYNRALGGYDFDERIALWFEEQSSVKRGSEALALLRMSESAKYHLSFNQTTVLRFEGITQNLSRELFNDITSDLVESISVVVDTCIENARIPLEKIEYIVVAGGNACIPSVQDMLQKKFEKRILNSIDPAMVTTLGAAVKAVNICNKVL